MGELASAIRAGDALRRRMRPMTAADVPVVAALERMCFPNPWSENAFLAEVEREESLPLVVVDGNVVVAYGVAWTVVDELHIVNVAVAPRHRRQGIATSLTKEMIARGRAEGARMATLEVRSRNAGAIRLYHSLGFTAVAIRRGYYRDPPDDALVMARDLERSEAQGAGG